jgi:hypothetical protein
MTKRAKRACLVVPLVLLVLLVLMGLFPPKPKEPSQEQLQSSLNQAYHKEVQRLYRQEVLALYDPPAEAFTPAGYKLIRQIQDDYSKLFLPYLVSGATIVQQDVLWNPYFDMFILVEDSDGLIHNVVLASSLAGGQTPQRNLRGDYWQQMYQRYQIAQIVSFNRPTPYKDFTYVIRQMRNLTNHFHWPVRISLSTANTPFDLYIQQADQAIYCTPVEPGAYVIFNVTSNKLHTNVMDLPPFTVYATQKQVQQQIDESNDQGRRLLQERADRLGKKAAKEPQLIR